LRDAYFHYVVMATTVHMVRSIVLAVADHDRQEAGNCKAEAIHQESLPIYARERTGGDTSLLLLLTSQARLICSES
jgi:hypothetical protein